MIPTIEITTDNIRAKYQVREEQAHKIMNIILDDYNKELIQQRKD